MAEYTTVTNITSGNIGNALHSVAIDHVVAIAKDIYDTEFVRAGGKGGYQSEINSGFSESLNELSANTNALLNELSANTDAHFNVVESALTDFSANTNTHFGILDEHTDDLLDRCSGFTYMTNDEYAYAIVDPNGVMLFGIRYNGDVVYNTGMSDEVRGRLNELEGVQVMQNDQYIFAILDEQQNVLFGIKADGTVVEPKNEFDAKIEKVQKKANENYSFCVALSAVTIALQEQIDAMSASTSEAIDKLVDFDNTISAVTEHISGLTETLSGVSDATVERLHDFDGWNLVEGDFMLGIADINGYQLLKIDNSGKTFVGNGLVVYGEKAGLDVMDVNNYVYAVTDSEDKVLFGVTTNGASVINKSLTFNDLGGEFTIMEDTPEWAYVIQDANKNVVFGIDLDGNTYIPKGMSEDTKARFKELEGIQVFDKSENWNIVFADPNGNIPFGITTDGTTFIAKGIPEDSKVKFNEIKKRFEQIEGIQVLENTDNFMYAIVDSENTVVFGIKPDGSTYSPKGIPADVQSRFDELEPIEVLAETANYLFAFVDQEGKVPFGIMSDGTTFIAKGMSEDTKARFKELEGIQVWENTEGWIYAIADSDRNVLFGIQDDGTTYMPKGIPQDVQEKLDEFQYSIMHDETYIYAITDKKGLVLFGIDNSGRTIVNDITGNIGTMETVESDKFVYAIYDQAGNVLFAILTDGSVWVSQFDVSVLSGMSLNSQYLQEFEDEEFIHIVNDKEGKIVFGVTWDGTTYIPKGIPEDTKAEIKRIDKKITSIEEKINNSEIEIDNIALNKVMYNGNQGRSYLGNVTLQTPGMTDYCIIMMYGQSLSNGSENPAGYYDTPVDNCYMLESNVWNTTGSNLYPLTVGGTRRSDDVATGTRQDTIVSTVNSFATLYKKERPWDNNTKFIACSLGVGGYTVAQLSGAARYPNCSHHILDTKVKPFFESVKAIADAEGKTISLSAVFWKQGESDYGTGYIGKTYEEWKNSATGKMGMGGSYDAYYKGLNYLKEDIFNLAKNIFGDYQQNRPVFMPYSVCGTYINNAYMTINAATQQLSEDFDDIIQVGPTYVTPDYNGGHLAMNGYRWFGEYCAKALYHVYLKGIDWTPLQPYNYEVNGNKIYIYLNPIVPPLRFDKYTIDGAYKNLGFSVRMGSVTELDANKTMTGGNLLQRITDIAIIENCIVLTCGDIAEFTGAVEVSYAGQGESGYSGHFQGAGNLRDSDTWKPLYSYRNDEADHGSRTSFNIWRSVRIATEQDLQNYEFWNNTTTYSYGDMCLYTNATNDVTYLISSNKDDNLNKPPFTTGTTWNSTNYWVGSSEATDEEMETLEYLDEDYLTSTGYEYGDKVLFNMIERVKPTVLTCAYGGVNANITCKQRPANPVNYHTLDVKGNTIVGKPYPMQNWCLNFYKRIILG